MIEAIDNGKFVKNEKTGKRERRVLIDFADLRQNFLGLMDTTVQPKGSTLRGLLARWKSGRGDGFSGDTGEGMRSKLENGYTPPHVMEPDDYTPHVATRRIIRTDEGAELDFALAWSGDPTPFSEWEQREQKPGLSVIVDYSINCGTPEKVVGEYATWLAGMFAGLELAGYDVEILVRNSVTMLCSGDSREDVSHTDLRVKRENEASDFTEWSALFSPGGFRILMFTALCLHGDEVGRQATGSLGYPMGSKWEVDFDESNRTLYIGTPNGASSFPADKMTAELAATGLIK